MVSLVLNPLLISYLVRYLLLLQSKAITRLAATWKGKGASKKSALKKGGNVEERIENPYSMEDLVDNSNMYEELVVKSP
jgi:hypothetical protein